MNSADRQALATRVSGMTLDAIHREIALEVVAAHAAMERRDALAQLAVHMADRDIESAEDLGQHAVAVILANRRWADELR